MNPHSPEPVFFGSIGESSVLVPECELDVGMWKKEVRKRPRKETQFDEVGKEWHLEERISPSPHPALLHTLAYMKSWKEWSVLFCRGDFQLWMGNDLPWFPQRRELGLMPWAVAGGDHRTKQWSKERGLWVCVGTWQILHRDSRDELWVWKLADWSILPGRSVQGGRSWVKESLLQIKGVIYVRKS